MTEQPRRLLDRIAVLQYPCDLDLLIFFARHPSTLLGNEQLAILLGYEFEQVADSLEVLQQAGLVKLSENPSHIARMYAFVAGDSSAGWLPDLLQLAGTRDGRLALLQALRRADDRDRLMTKVEGNDAGTGSRQDRNQRA